MAWSTYQLSLAFMMLVTGSINTLSTKWADNSKAVGLDGKNLRAFDHPFLQTVGMFLGELSLALLDVVLCCFADCGNTVTHTSIGTACIFYILCHYSVSTESRKIKTAVGMFLGELSCLALFHIVRIVNTRRGNPINLGNQNFSPFIFLPAALCDMCATSTMYIGLNITFASSFQMLRGAVIIFTALLSVVFLHRVIRSHMWLGMVGIIIGLVTVGVSDMIFSNTDMHDRNGIIAGDLLIIIAQVITACQMVYEERFVLKHNIPPLQAVGWEGFFGFFVLGALLYPMYYIKVGHPFSNDPDGRLENVLDAFRQMSNNYVIIIATIGNIVSIAFFNFSGISVTKELSATTRMVLDSCRTVIIWMVSMSIGWQQFAWTSFLVQALGFIFLIIGMCIYNDIIFAPYLRRHGCLKQLDADNLLSPVSDILDVDETSPLIQDDSNRSYS